MNHIVWFIVYDRGVSDLWVSFPSMGVICLISVAEGEFSNDGKQSAAWDHKYESINSKFLKWVYLYFSDVTWQNVPDLVLKSHLTPPLIVKVWSNCYNNTKTLSIIVGTKEKTFYLTVGLGRREGSHS